MDLEGGDVITPEEGVSFSTNKDQFTGRALHQWGHLFLTCVKIDKQEVTLRYSQQKEEKMLPCPITAQPMGDCQGSANEKTLYFEFNSFLQWTLQLQQPLPSP